MEAKSKVPAKPKRRWRWWAWWGFVILNVAAVVLIWPLLKAAVPLVGIWWQTHSQASFRSHLQQQARSAQLASNSAAAAADTNVLLSGLTNQLKVVQGVSGADLGRIVAAQFGPKNYAPSDPKKFDADSAVFDTITSTNLLINGRLYYCYEIDLVDRHRNHRVSIDAFTEPNLEYERSKATMELVNRTPELKKIYDAMAYVLAEKSAAAATNNADNSSSPKPALRLVKDPDAKEP